MKNKRALFALQAENLSVGRRGQILLSGVNFTLQPGSSLAVIGESGCGKTTLLQTLAGILPAVAGDVACHSSESAGKPVNAIVWQNLALFPWLTVAGNLALPLKLKKESNIAERVREMLSELELEGLERRFPAALSGGQRQRLALGRALIAKPDVLFMDEPFSALDAVLREHLQHFLKQLRERHPCTMVFVTTISVKPFISASTSCFSGRALHALLLLVPTRALRLTPAWTCGARTRFTPYSAGCITPLRRFVSAKNCT